MKDIDIKWFGSKLMVASKSINKIPENYLKLALNARIYDAGIWPRKWKRLISESILWTNTKWAFLLKNKLYQITNSRIYEIDKISGNRTEKAVIWYDVFTDLLVYDNNFAIIVAKWQKLKVFDWNSVTEPSTVPAGNTGYILEYTRGYTFYWIWNVLYISKPIKPGQEWNAYDFTNPGSQTITYDSEITWLKGTMKWLYVFTKDKVEYIWEDSLQNISWSPTFLSSPLWSWWEPINNQSIIASWDRIFYITKNLQLNTINYITWTEGTSIWELSTKPIISIKEFLNTLDYEQETAFWFYNQNDKTIQFHLRTKNSNYNNRCLVYDLINDTFCIDIWKFYNYIVKDWYKYFWFSDVNSSVYEDDVWNTDAWSSIWFKILTQEMNQWSIAQKRFWWFFTAWAIWIFSELNYTVRIDWNIVFQDSIKGQEILVSDLWEIWWSQIWQRAIWWDLWMGNKINSFDKWVDEWRIFIDWTRIQIEITCNSVFQDFLIDVLWVRAEANNNIDIKQKW